MVRLGQHNCNVVALLALGWVGGLLLCLLVEDAAYIGYRLRALATVGGHQPKDHPTQPVADAVGHGEGLVLVVRHVVVDIRGQRRLLVRQEEVERGAKGVEVGPGTKLVEGLLHLLARCVAIGVADGRGGRCPAARLHLLARTEVDESHPTLLVHHQVGRLEVEVEETVAVDHLQRVEHLVEDLPDGGLVERVADLLEIVAEVLAIDEVHDIVGRAVLLEEVVDTDDMRTGEFAQAHGLLLELVALGLEGGSVLLVADADSGRIFVALRHALEEELLDGVALTKLDVGGNVSIAKTARCQVAIDAVGAVQDRAHTQHIGLVDRIAHFLFLCLRPGNLLSLGGSIGHDAGW